MEQCGQMKILKNILRKKRMNELEIITDNYSIYQGDCLEVMDGIKDESIDLIITDPTLSY